MVIWLRSTRPYMVHHIYLAVFVIRHVFFPLGAFFSCALRQTNASAEEKAEALSDVDDEFAGRQQQLETRTVQVLYTEHGNLKYHSPQVPP